MLRALLRWRWIHAVSFVLLAFLTASLVAVLRESLDPPQPIEASVDLLLQHPPLGKRVRVSCDKVERLGQETKNHKVETVVVLCAVGPYLLPVTLGPNDAMPTLSVKGTLVEMRGNELWLREGIRKDGNISSRNFNIYLDAKSRDEQEVILISVGMVGALWLWWALAFLQRRRRRAREAEHVEATFYSRKAAPAAKRESKPPSIPNPLAGKLRFAAALCEINAAGLDARREDGSTVLVLWADVVGIVARKLPASHGGATFVDVISTAGSTLRFLPWTRWIGDAIDGTAKVLVETLAARSPSAKLDRATQAFVAGEPAMQLPDATTLDEHDRRIG